MVTVSDHYNQNGCKQVGPGCSFGVQQAHTRGPVEDHITVPLRWLQRRISTVPSWHARLNVKASLIYNLVQNPTEILRRENSHSQQSKWITTGTA